LFFGLHGVALEAFTTETGVKDCQVSSAD